MGKRITNNNDSIFLGTEKLIVTYERILLENRVENKMPEWNYLNAVFYCGTVFTTIGKFET